MDRGSGEIYIEIVTPNQEKIAFSREIDKHTFYENLQPIHINKNPFMPDDEKEILKIRQTRDCFIGLIKDMVDDAFSRYLETKDTINGELIAESNTNPKGR